MGGIGSGGARPRSGPPPDTGALRRERDGKDWTRLPAVGLTDADVPPWPDTMPPYEVNAEGEASLLFGSDEIAMWTRLWKKPQARVWKADGVEDLVALYVRTYLEAAAPGGPVGKGTLAKQLGEQLLLSTPALHAARYVIDASLGAPASGLFAVPEPTSSASDVRGGLSVVPLRPPSARDDWSESTPVDDDE